MIEVHITQILIDMKTKQTRNYENEAREIIYNLKTDSKYAERFFFDTLKPMVCGLLSKLNACYQEKIYVEEISSQLYLLMWSEGTWSRLDSFQFKCSFFSWLSIVATHEMFRHFDALGYHRLRKKASSNTRLRLLSQPEDVRKAVVSLVEIEPLRNYLNLKYVLKKDIPYILEKLNLTHEELKMTHSIAIRLLKEILISSDSIYAPQVLSTDSYIVLVGEKALTYVPAEEKDDIYKDLQSILVDYIGINPNSPDSQEQFAAFIYRKERFIKAANNYTDPIIRKEQEKRSQMHLDIFVKRYVFDEKPEKLAAEYGIKRSAVDNIKKRHLRRLCSYLHETCNRKRV